MNSIPLVDLFSSIQGKGPYVGRRQAFLRFHGCNLDCDYCDTVQPASPAFCRVEEVPGSGLFDNPPNPISLSSVMEILGGWLTRYPGVHHSLSLTGGEPLLHRDILVRWLPNLMTLFPLYLETNGTLPEALVAVIDCIRYISMDIKLPSASGCPPLWKTHRQFLEVAVRREVFVKVVVGPDTSPEEIESASLLIRDARPSIPLILQPVTRNGVSAAPASLLLRYQEQAARILDDVRVIPQTHVFLNIL